MYWRFHQLVSFLCRKSKSPFSPDHLLEYRNSFEKYCIRERRRVTRCFHVFLLKRILYKVHCCTRWLKMAVTVAKTMVQRALLHSWSLDSCLKNYACSSVLHSCILATFVVHKQTVECALRFTDTKSGSRCGPLCDASLS